MKTLVILFLLPSISFSSSIYRDFRFKREINAQNFANQDSSTIYQPLQCLQQCTQSQANDDSSRQTIAMCIPDIQKYIAPMLQNSSMPSQTFQSILTQPPIDDCVNQCDPNDDNIVGDLSQALKYFTDFACNGDNTDNDDSQCFQSLNEQFPNLKDEDVIKAPGNTIACKLVSITKQICQNSEKPANAMAAFVNILTTFETRSPYTPIDKCT